MKKKILSLFMVLAITLFNYIPSMSVNAVISDQDDPERQIIRKTTSNYYTTVKLEGTLYNEITGETLTFNKTSEETTGNVDDEAVASIITSYKNEFNTWANEKGSTKIDAADEGIADYYYEAHDEITQDNGNGGSDVILVGNIDDLDSAYTSQGTITINTILDKYQTYTIKMKATVEDKGIKSVSITLEAPTVGNKVTSTLFGDENMGYYEQDNKPVATTSDNITVDETAWIKGTYPLVGDDYMDYISTTFEKDKYYYAMISISAKDGYTLSNNLSIKVNGEAPAEVFAVYNNDNTYFIAKIKAVEEEVEYKILDGADQNYTINSTSDLVIRANGELNKLTGIKVDGTIIDKNNYTTASGSTILTLKTSYLNSLSVGKHTLTFVYDNGSVDTTFTVLKETTKKTINNPKTSDNIEIYLSMLILSIIGFMGLYTIRKKSNI